MNKKEKEKENHSQNVSDATLNYSTIPTLFPAVHVHQTSHTHTHTPLPTTHHTIFHPQQHMVSANTPLPQITARHTYEAEASVSVLLVPFVVGMGVFARAAAICHAGILGFPLTPVPIPR